MIIDRGSCTNVVSTFLTIKLGLKSTRHPKPCKPQWLNYCSETKVNKQAMIQFLIGRYEEKVTCYVVLVQACHVLLGRLWQFDRRVIHNGFSNKYSFVQNDKNLTLAHVYEDHLQFQQSFEK